MTLAQSWASAFAALLYEVFAQTGSYFSILIWLYHTSDWESVMNSKTMNGMFPRARSGSAGLLLFLLTHLPKIHPLVRDVCYVYIFQLSMKLQTYFCSGMEHILVNGLATCVVWWGKQILKFFWFFKEWKYNYITNVGKPQNPRIRNISTLMI